MAIYNTGQKDSQSLSDGHNDSECDWPKLSYGVKYEKLTPSRAQTKDNGMENEIWMSSHKCYRIKEAPLFYERNARQQTGEEIHSCHHLYGGNLVALEEFSLPV